MNLLLPLSPHTMRKQMTSTKKSHQQQSTTSTDIKRKDTKYRITCFWNALPATHTSRGSQGDAVERPQSK